MQNNGLQPLMHPAHIQGRPSSELTINYETHYGFKPGIFALQRDKESQDKLVAFLVRYGLIYVKLVGVTYNGGAHTRRAARFYEQNHKPHIEVDRYVCYLCDGVRAGSGDEKVPLSNKDLLELLKRPPAASYKDIKRLAAAVEPPPADKTRPPGSIAPPVAPPAQEPPPVDKTKDSPLNGFTTDPRKVKALLDSLRPHEPFSQEFFGRTIRAQIHAPASSKSVSFVMHQMIKKGLLITDNGDTSKIVVAPDTGGPPPEVLQSALARAAAAPTEPTKPQSLSEKMAVMQKRLEQLPVLEAQRDALSVQAKAKEDEASRLIDEANALGEQRKGVEAEIAKLVELKQAWAFVEEQLG